MCQILTRRLDGSEGAGERNKRHFIENPQASFAAGIIHRIAKIIPNQIHQASTAIACNRRAALWAVSLGSGWQSAHWHNAGITMPPGDAQAGIFQARMACFV
jgi:hypothetical protein